jgi:predicted RNA-binding protein with RPS1 domain
MGEPIILSKHRVQLTFMSMDSLSRKISISVRNIETNTEEVQDRKISNSRG